VKKNIDLAGKDEDDLTSSVYHKVDQRYQNSIAELDKSFDDEDQESPLELSFEDPNDLQNQKS
jgi:hypothetical protein